VGNAIDALFYLRAMSFKNAVISRVLRLKQPKYLVGAIVGVAYIFFVVFPRRRGDQTGGADVAGLSDAFPIERLPMVAALGALVLTVIVALYWLLPRERAALAFSEAEIAFLFPAPIGRKTLIHYRWINTQLRILFTSLILTLVSSGWSFVPGDAWIRLVGWWLLLSTLDLHGVGSSFAITRLLDRGVTSLRRRLLTFIGVGIVVGAACLWTWGSLRPPVPAEFASFTAVLDYVASLLSAEALSWLLLPARWVVEPLLATDFSSLSRALGPALLIYGAHYAWVLRSEVTFEEASIAKAQKRAARVSAMRAGTWRFGSAERKARNAPFALSKVARPELAFVWKNLLSSAQYLRPRTALIAAAIITVGSSLAATGDFDVPRNVVAVVAMACAAYTLVFGPMLARQDLRLDLPNADVLKTYPLRGWQIVLGEWLTPVAIVTVLLWLLLLTAALNFNADELPWLSVGVRGAAAIVAALLAPLLCALMVLLLNSAAVLFPAWVQVGPGRPGGIDVLGQRIVFVGALFFVMAMVLLPAAIVAAVTFFLVQWLAGFLLATAAAVIIVLAILGSEIATGTWWLGKRFESFDLSAELRP
jgi:hypothetical protein